MKVKWARRNKCTIPPWTNSEHTWTELSNVHNNVNQVIFCAIFPLFKNPCDPILSLLWCNIDVFTRSTSIPLPPNQRCRHPSKTHPKIPLIHPPAIYSYVGVVPSSIRPRQTRLHWFDPLSCHKHKAQLSTEKSLIVDNHCILYRCVNLTSISVKIIILNVKSISCTYICQVK